VNRNAVPGTTAKGTDPRDFLKAIENRGKTTTAPRTGTSPQDFLAAIANRGKTTPAAPRTGTVGLQDFLTSIENGTIIKGSKKRPTGKTRK
jgi:hypothetical protein